MSDATNYSIDEKKHAANADNRPDGVVRDLAAAFLSSSVYTSAFYPLHRVKVLLQTQDSDPLVISGKVQRYAFFSSFQRLASEQGWQSLWRGYAPYMLRHVPSTTMSFAFKDLFRSVIPSDPAKNYTLSVLANIASGGLAGLLALAIVYPLDFATIKMASEVGKRNAAVENTPGMTSVFQHAFKSSGVSALYRGFGVSALAIAGYKSLYFGLYDSAKDSNFMRVNDEQDSWLLRNLRKWVVASGVVYVASTVTYPLDVVRKRLVADGGLQSGTRQYSGLLDCMRKIAQKEGMAGFYRFYGYDMLLRFGGGILLVMYDEARTIRIPRL